MAMTPQEAASKGLGWVPENHPLYGKAGFVGSQPGAGGQAPNGQNVAVPTAQNPYGTPDAGAAGGTNTQAQNAQTYSTNAAGAPTGPTTNQGTQDVVRNKWLQLATQAPADRTNANVRAQGDAYGAQVERSRRNYLDESAEKLGPYATGALDQERRLTAERAGQDIGGFEAQLVGRELEAQRAEIQQALSQLGGMISEDQRQALQAKLAELDAALRREGLGAQTALGNRELDLRGELGRGDLNLRALLAALSNKQFGKQLGFQIGAKQADLNNDALRWLL